jgi:hypothetical protein
MDKAITDSAASVSKGRVYTLADVLLCEFEQLHENERDGTLSQERTAKQQSHAKQPIEDPSLSPADQQTRGQRNDSPETRETPPGHADDDPDATKLRNLWEKVHALEADGRTALCLSGGGVRSAAFNLGVLQGLARLELLSQFHYLSTVSGGGYIGSRLLAWRHRCKEGISEVTSGLAWPDRIGCAEAPSRVPPAISNLRRGISYLTPVKGILSPDAWATVTVVGRNLILNHVVIVPLIAALLLIVKLLCAVADHDYFFRYAVSSPKCNSAA